MQWLEDTNESYIDNLNNVRREASRHCRKKKQKEYLKAKTDEPETNIMIKNIRDLYRGNSEFKNVYQLRTNIVKDEKGDLLTDCHSILAWWRNSFPQLLNVHGVSAVRQTEIQTTEPLLREPSAFELEMAIEKIKTEITRY